MGAKRHRNLAWQLWWSFMKHCEIHSNSLIAPSVKWDEFKRKWWKWVSILYNNVGNIHVDYVLWQQVTCYQEIVILWLTSSEYWIRYLGQHWKMVWASSIHMYPLSYTSTVKIDYMFLFRITRWCHVMSPDYFCYKWSRFWVMGGTAAHTEKQT